MHPNGNGGIDSDNFEAGVSGYSFGKDGDAEFNQLTLRGGIISNSALTDPVVPQVVNQLMVANFGLTAGTYTTLISLNLTPPAGATTGLVTLQGVVSALNTTAATDYQYASVVIGSSVGDGWATACEPNTYNPAIGPHSSLVTGITGTLAVALKAQSGVNNWPSGAGKAKPPAPSCG